MRPAQRSTTTIALIRLRAIAATLVLTLFANGLALAAPPNPVDIHNAISERGIGKGVKIKETGGTIVTGTLTAIHIDSFELIPVGASQPVTLSYTEVSAVHHSGLRLPRGAKIADPVPVYNTLTVRGVGTLVKIKQMDGTVLTSTLAALHTDTFEIAPVGTTQPVTLSYTQVSAVDDGMPGRSTGAKIELGIGVGVLVVVAAAIVAILIFRRY